MMEALLQSRAIQAHFDTLITGTKSDRERIAYQSYAKGLIPAVLTESPDMGKIIHTIQDRISMDRTGAAFKNFLNILCSDPSTEHLAGTLKETLERLRQSPLEASSYGTIRNLAGTSYGYLQGVSMNRFSSCNSVEVLGRDVATSSSEFTLPSLTGQSGGFDLPLMEQSRGFNFPPVGQELPLAADLSSELTLPSLIGHSGGFEPHPNGLSGDFDPHLTGQSRGFDHLQTGQESAPAKEFTPEGVGKDIPPQAVELISQALNHLAENSQPASPEQSFYADGDRYSLQLAHSQSTSTDGYETESIVDSYQESEEDSPSVNTESSIQAHGGNFSSVGWIENISSAGADPRIEGIKVLRHEQSYCSIATSSDGFCLAAETESRQSNCDTPNFLASTSNGKISVDTSQVNQETALNTHHNGMEASADISRGNTTKSRTCYDEPTATSVRQDNEPTHRRETEQMQASKDESGYGTTLSRKTSSDDNSQDIQAACKPSKQQPFKKVKVMDHDSVNQSPTSDTRRSSRSTGIPSPAHEVRVVKESEASQQLDQETTDPNLRNPMCSGSEDTRSLPAPLMHDPSTEELATRLETCTLQNQDTQAVESKGCCDHLREIESLSRRVELLKAEREGERGYLITICMEKDSLKRKRDVLKTRLRGLTAKNRRQAKKIQELESKMAGLSSHESQSIAQREHIAKLTQQIMYMEAFCNETQAETIRAQEELVSVRTRLMEHIERERFTKEKFATPQASLTESYFSRKETDGLKRRVRILEKLIQRFDGTQGGRDDTDDPGDAEDKTDATDTNTGRKLKRVNSI